MRRVRLQKPTRSAHDCLNWKTRHACRRLLPARHHRTRKRPTRQSRTAVGPRNKNSIPSDARAFAQLGRARLLLRDIEGARTAAISGAALRPEDPLTLDTLGVVLSHLGEHAQAAESFRAAVTRFPNNANFLYNLGTSLKFAGDRSGAADALQKALDMEPALHNARFALSYLQKVDHEHNHVAEYAHVTRELLLRPPAGHMQLGYALAKEYDDLDEFEDAWTVLAETNTRYNRASGYQPQDDPSLSTN